MFNKAAAQSLKESVGSKVLGPSVTLSARALIDSVLRKGHLRENVTPSDGIFYVIRTPSGWQLYAYRYDEYPSIDHSELWSDYVTPVLAHNWGRGMPEAVRRLEQALSSLTYAFPRGRVSRNGPRRYTVHFGNDFTKLGVSKATVERAFSLTGVAKWETDDHEQCQQDDRDAVRRLLRLKETWPAASTDFGFD